MRLRILPLCAFMLISLSCSERNQEHNAIESRLVANSITDTFPGAVPFHEYVDSLLFFLYTVHNISQDRILLGQSSCMDDVINTKTAFARHAVKGPFNLGGLAGLPFTGITGYNAFAHHVPDQGAALIFLGSHTGYSSKHGWGKIIREGQQEPSSCCGAIVNALDKLKKGEIVKMMPHGDDYQEEVIEQLALQHKKELMSAKDPLITFTKQIYQESENMILNFPLTNTNFKYLILVVGVIINTDHGDPDFIWVDHMAIYDLEMERQLRGMEE